MSQIELSKFLSYVLRHRPDAIGIELDEEGFTDAKVLVEKMAERHPGFAMRDLEAIVRDDDKGRYTLRDGQIRGQPGPQHRRHHRVRNDAEDTARYPLPRHEYA